jgi:hypothetical protein
MSVSELDEIKVRNATIRTVSLGYEDHDIMTAFLHLDYGNSGQGFGGYCLGGEFGIEFIKAVLDTLDVRSWEDLPGKSCRAKGNWGHVTAIGHFLEDKWFNPKELAKKLGVGE